MPKTKKAATLTSMYYATYRRLFLPVSRDFSLQNLYLQPITESNEEKISTK